MQPKKLLAALSALAAFSAAPAHAINLYGIGFVTFGDALSYSMPFANYQAIGEVSPNPGDPFYIASSPGAIQDLVVIATGTNNGPVNTNFAGMDNPFETPSGHSGGNFFSTGSVTEAGQVSAFTGDRSGTWDATVASLVNFLQGDQMVFFFNNNQDNSGGSFNQSLAIWAQAWVTDPSGAVVVAPGQSGYYDVSNNGMPFALTTEGGGGTIIGDPTAYTSAGRVTAPGTNDYVLAGGQYCAASSFGGALVPCASPVADIGPVNHNLGANNAAYAVVLPELNGLIGAIASNPGAQNLLDHYTLHLDIRMGCDPSIGAAGDAACSGGGTTWNRNLNSGYEQIFMGRATFNGPTPPGNPVPEPAAPALLGAAMLAAVGARRLSRGRAAA